MIQNLYFMLIFTLAFCSNTIAQDTLKTSVYFETASYALNKDELKKLTTFKKELALNKITAVILSGYTDDIGSDASNKVLSKNRALEVKEQLGRLEFPISRNDRTKGFGALSLKIDTMAIDEQRRLNRRVDVLVIYELPPSPEVLVIEKVPPKIEIATEKVEVGVKKLDNSLKVGDKVTMAKLIFIGGRDLLRYESNSDLDELENFLKENPKYKIVILGHVCCVNTGQDGYNTETATKTLSLDRAKKIYDLLSSRGINKNRMQYRGLKAAYPTGNGEDADRRVEIQIADIEE